MTSAAALLAERIRQSGARRVAFVGLAKNVGKTTALVSTLEELHRLSIIAGTTSAGRDGEDFDAITGEPKPRFRVWPGQLVASADSTFASASFSSTLIRELPYSTRFGPIVLRRVEAGGDVEIIGPTTVSQIAESCEALETAGAGLVLLDGAFGRRAFASARIADGIVLSVGMAAAASLEAVVESARSAIELLRLTAAPPGRPARFVEGALTGLDSLEDQPHSGDVLVAEDFASVFLSPEERRRLEEQGVKLAVRRPANLLAVTANPTAPGRPALPAPKFFETLRLAFPNLALLDLRANLSSGLP